MPETSATTLPKNVKPVRYRLELEPNLDDFTFSGEESVDFEVLEPTSDVTLNCVEITIQSSMVTLNDGESIAPRDTVYNESQETVTFKFDAPLPAGPARLDIRYTGELNDKLRGFYRSRYNRHRGPGALPGDDPV